MPRLPQLIDPRLYTDNMPFNFVTDVMRPWAELQPDVDALLWIGGDGRERRHSYAAICEGASHAAAVLAQIGVQRGDTVLLILGREERWWEIMLGCLQLGAVASPGTVQLSARDIRFRLEASGAVAIVSNAACAERVEIAAAQGQVRGLVILDDDRAGWTCYEKARKDLGPSTDAAATLGGDDALCFFTSGTTGYPKMARHVHRYPLGHIATGRDWLGLRPGALCWNLSDTGWAKAAWSSLCAPWMMGATVMAHDAQVFDASATLAKLEQYPVETLCAPPTAYRMFVLEDLSALKPRALTHCTAAGEPLNPETLDRWAKATSITIRDGYGQTETPLLCGNFHDRQVRAGSMGVPAHGIEVSIVDEEGRPVPAGVEGEIAVDLSKGRPAGLFAGYRGGEAVDRDTLHGRWYLTGDRGRRDDEGYFWFVGRSDDVILSSGYRIGPFEVESALLEHPAVAESGVVASPDEVRGEVVKAFVVLAPGHGPSEALAEELQRHVRSVTAPYKYPRRVEFVSALPKTISGKILRRELRAREWEPSVGT